MHLSDHKTCMFASGMMMIRTEDGIEVVLMPDEVKELRKVLNEQEDNQCVRHPECS